MRLFEDKPPKLEWKATYDVPVSGHPAEVERELLRKALLEAPDWAVKRAELHTGIKHLSWRAGVKWDVFGKTVRVTK